MSVDFFWVGPSMMASRPCVFAFGVGADVGGLWGGSFIVASSSPLPLFSQKRSKTNVPCLHSMIHVGKEKSCALRMGCSTRVICGRKVCARKWGSILFCLFGFYVGIKVQHSFSPLHECDYGFSPSSSYFSLHPTPFFPPLLIS